MIQVKQHSDAIAAFVGVILLLVFALALAAVCGGCSHNAGMAINGKFINLGYDPETNKVGIQYYDGVVVTGIARENSESALTYTTTTGGENVVNAKGQTTSEMKYTQKIGKQITGYYVDAIAAGAKAKDLNAYTASPVADK